MYRQAAGGANKEKHGNLAGRRILEGKGHE